MELTDSSIPQSTAPSSESTQTQGMATTQEVGESAARAYFQSLFTGQPESSGTEQVEQPLNTQAPVNPAPEPGLQANTQPATPEPPLILGRYKDQQALEKGYLNIQSAYTKATNQVAELQRQLDSLINVQNMNTQQPQQMPQVQGQEAEPDNQKWLDTFYEKPIENVQQVAAKTVEQVIQEKVMPLLAPVLQQHQAQVMASNFQKSVAEFSSATDEFGNVLHPDFDDYKQDMQRIITQNQNLLSLPNWVEVAYQMAKGERYQPVNMEALAKDPEFISKYVLSNAEIKEQFLKSHVEEIKNGTPPPVMGSALPPSGITPTPQPPKNASDFKEAGERFLKTLGLR